MKLRAIERSGIDGLNCGVVGINLDDGLPPVCTMTEVVWRSDDDSGGRCMAGFQFLNILEADMKRIRKFVKTPPAKESADS